MADTDNTLPRLTPDQRRAAAGQYERANQVLAKGDYDYALPLLLNCCLIDPANPVYRQVLRQATKNKYKNNLRGQPLSFVANTRIKMQMKRALRNGEHLLVLELGERALLRNPWDVATHLAMAEAFEELGLLDLAVWTLEQARQNRAEDPEVNRPLARLYERRGNFNQAITLWQLVRKALPHDVEAQNKAKDLAASATIAKGRYEKALTGEAPTPMAQALSGEMPAPSEEELTLPSQPNEDRIREAPGLYAKIKADPTNAHNYLQLARLYRRLDMFDKAREVLQQGVAATNHFEISLELADLDIEPFRRDLGVVEEKLRRDRHNKDLTKVKQQLAKEIGARELVYWQQKVDRVPSDSHARFEMALRLMKVGQIDEAIKELQGLRSDPRHQGKVLVYLGFCFKSRNNWRLAQRNFEDSLPHLGHADEGLRKEVLFQLASGHAEAGDYTRAVDLACELANLDFGYRNISELLDQWQTKMQKA